jgi:hypothetical protein
VTGKFPFAASNIAGLFHLCSGISPSFVLSEANDMMDFLFSVLARGGGGGGGAFISGRVGDGSERGIGGGFACLGGF